MDDLEKAIAAQGGDVLEALRVALKEIKDLEEAVEDYRSENFWLRLRCEDY